MAALSPSSPAGPVLTVPPLHECGEVQFTWVSNAGPFKAWLWTGNGGAGTILADFGNVPIPQQGYVIDIVRGSEVQFSVRDAAGHVTNSPPVIILPGDCAPDINLRTLSATAPTISVKDPPPASSTPTAGAVISSSSKPAAIPIVPASTFSPGPSRVVIKPEDSSIALPTVTGTVTPPDAPYTGSEPRVPDSSRIPGFSMSSALNAVLSTTAISAGSLIGPFAPIGSSPAHSTSQVHGSVAASYYTSASSIYPVLPLQSGSSPDTEETPPKSNATMIAGIVGGVSCAILFFGLIFYVLCRHRRQNIQFGGRTSDDDYVHFSDNASARSSFPPFYANFRSHSQVSNMAGRGAGGVDDGANGPEAEFEKADIAILGQGSNPFTDHPQLGHIPYTDPRDNNDDSASSISPYDMGSHPILDPAILGRSAPPKPRPTTARSTWRSSFGAVFNWMVPPSPAGTPSAFKLGNRGSRWPHPNNAGEGSETLTSVGLSRTNTFQTQRSGIDSTFGGPASGFSGGADEKSQTYRDSFSTLAHPTSRPSLTIANPTTPTAAAFAALASTYSRTLFPRRKSDATIQTSRSRRSIATFGATDLALLPQAALRSPTAMPTSGLPSGGLISPVFTSPGSEDSFGDLFADKAELADAQPDSTPRDDRVNDLASFQLPPITTSTVLVEPMGEAEGQTEGVVSRVSIAKYERPRTLMFTRHSLAVSAFGSSISVDSSVNIPAEPGMGGAAELGDEADADTASSFGGRLSGWRSSLRRSFGGGVGADTNVGRAI